jgi:hypothetical protein
MTADVRTLKSLAAVTLNNRWVTMATGKLGYAKTLKRPRNELFARKKTRASKVAWDRVLRRPGWRQLRILELLRHRRISAHPQTAVLLSLAMR